MAFLLLLFASMAPVLASTPAPIPVPNPVQGPTQDSEQVAAGVAEPADSERPSGLILHEPAAFEGYTLVGPIRSSSVYLLKMDGTVAHRWETDSSPGASVSLLGDGSLLRCTRVWENPVFRGGGIGGRLQLISWEGELLWDYPMASESITQHHDAEALPNGNMLVIVWERKPPGTAEQAGRDPQVLGPDGLWPDAVLEIKPLPPSGGEVVWEWHAWDHLIQDQNPRKDNFGVVANHPERIDINGDLLSPEQHAEERRRAADLARQMLELGYVAGGKDGAGGGTEARVSGDWLHTNSVSYHPEFDLILLSTPRFHEVWVIDHSTTTAEAAGSRGGRWGLGGDLLYRWGNPAASQRGLRGDRQLFAQHDARWVLTADGPDSATQELRLTLFNNGQGRPGGDQSSVDELLLPFDPDTGFRLDGESAYGPSQPLWSYGSGEGESFYSAFISGAQRLPNGNTLVCAGPQGRVFEVTPEGHIVWEFWNPFGGDVRANPNGGRVPDQALFRARRFAPEHPGVSRL